MNFKLFNSVTIVYLYKKLVWSSAQSFWNWLKLSNVRYMRNEQHPSAPVALLCHPKYSYLFLSPTLWMSQNAETNECSRHWDELRAVARLAYFSSPLFPSKHSQSSDRLLTKILFTTKTDAEIVWKLWNSFIIFYNQFL